MAREEQKGMLVHKVCPICTSEKIEFALKASSYRVKNETFDVFVCKSCSHKFTNPVPDEEAIGEYYKSENYISHTDSNKSFFDKAYQMVKKISLNNKEGLLSKYGVDKDRVFLDYGAGTGSFVNLLDERNWNVLGIEISSEARSQSAKRELLYNIDKLEDLDSESLSGFSMWHVLEHIYEPEILLKTLAQKMKRGAIGFIAVPNNDSWDAHYYGQTWAALDLPLHFSHFTKKSMKTLLDKAGLTLVKVESMPFDAYYISMLSEANKKTSLSTVKGVLNGFKSNVRGMSDNNTSSVIYVVKKI
jgi:2-polyprenyl-3-methyl-5-hydroxy-6-metoxy-1,4-benzoquinol methylase